MGKSPGKWIKNFLAKKSSKPKISKGKEKSISAKKEESLISSKVGVSNISADSPSISAPILVTGVRNVDSEKLVAVKSLNDGVTSLTLKEKEDDGINTTLSNQEDQEIERIKHEQAAKKAQAAFRGYRARKAFRTLKGIIRLQAFIRGHLVRRQAVVTLCCVHGIVRLQALARGRNVRCSDVGLKVAKKDLETVQGDRSTDSFGVSPYPQLEKLSKYGIVRKLVASSPTPTPLWLQYLPGEPNSTSEWLDRWTKMRFWQTPSQAVKNPSSKPHTKNNGGSLTVGAEQGKPKRNIRKLSSGSVEKSSIHSTSEYEKPKRNMRINSGHPVDSAREQSKSDIRKVKQNLKLLTDSAKEASNRLGANDDKQKHTLMKAANSAVPIVLEKGTTDSAEKKKDVTVAVLKETDLDIDEKVTVADIPAEELHDHLAINTQHAENIQTESGKDPCMEVHSKDENTSNENLRTSERRASLPAKVDLQDNGLHSTRKVPSYMVPTESAKAKLRGQGSPRLSQDVPEKNGVTRRYSLPSSVNGKVKSVSPRVHGLVQASGKGIINGDKSLSTSRDAGDKPTKAEWRR